MTTRRHAVYLTPGLGTPLGRLGRLALGLRPGEDSARPGPGVPRAALYGFHATLVAPFRSFEPASAIREALEGAARRLSQVEVGPLAVGGLPPGFPALVPLSPPEELFELERTLVTALSPLRRPPTPGEHNRRGPMTPRQRELFLKWGYPGVFEEFRLHLTLGDPIPDPAELGRRLRGLEGLFGGAVLDEGLAIDKLSLCAQEDIDEPFRTVFEVPLAPLAGAARPMAAPDGPEAWRRA
jgi:hypothetical protein